MNVTGRSAVPNDWILPWTSMSTPVVPDATPSINTSVPGWIVSVWPTGTSTSPVTWTMPLQLVAVPASVPAGTVSIGWPSRLVRLRLTFMLPSVAVSVKLPAPVAVTNALPRPL